MQHNDRSQLVQSDVIVAVHFQQDILMSRLQYSDDSFNI